MRISLCHIGLFNALNKPMKAYIILFLKPLYAISRDSSLFFPLAWIILGSLYPSPSKGQPLPTSASPTSSQFQPIISQQTYHLPSVYTPNKPSIIRDTPYPKDLQEKLDEQEREEKNNSKILSKTDIEVYNLPPCISRASEYHSAFTLLSEMASGTKKFHLKEAIFSIENAFYSNTGSYQNFDKAIQHAKQFINWKLEELNYDPNSNLVKNLILYQFFSDTLEIKSKRLIHYPFKYDFEDYAGDKDWSKLFVTKALFSHSGQCHSLPLLYLILADEIGAQVKLAYSPNHTYIKFQGDGNKWFNIELTNGMLTTDAFVLQSGYIKAEALQKRIYMQPLTEKQLLSYCLFDLSKGYVTKYCYDGFVETVIGKALELDSTNIHAQLLKSDYLTLRFNHISQKLGINKENYREKLNQYPQAKYFLAERNRQYYKIDNMGYENMPAEAYKNWLNSLNEAKQKQQSQQIFKELDKKLNINDTESQK